MALYLSSVQYIDWLELGAEESVNRIASKLTNPDDEIVRKSDYGKIRF